MTAYGQIGSAFSGTIAATTNGVLWLLHYPEDAPGEYEVRRIHAQWTTLAAFATLVVAGRALELVVGRPDRRGVSPSGGAVYNMAHKRDGGDEQLGLGRIATTGALTVTNFTLGNVRQRMALVHAGAAGSNYDEAWRFDGVEAEPLILLPGQFAAIRTNGALDAGGTGQLNVDVDARVVGA